MKKEDNNKKELDDLSFDKLLAERLNSKTEHSADDLWLGISDQLDQEEEQLFEEAIKEKMETLNLPNSEDSWTAIQEKLQEYRQVRTDIIVTKVLEIVGILILLGSLTPYSSILDNSKTLFSTTNKVLAKSKTIVQKLTDVLDATTKPLDELKPSSKNTTKQSTDPIEINEKGAPSSVPVNKEDRDTEDLKLIESLSPPTAATKQKIIHVTALVQEQQMLSYQQKIRKLTIIPDYTYSAKHITKELRAKKHFGVQAGIDYNIIKRPFDLQFLKQPQNFGAVGYTYAFTYSARKNRFEIGTGIVYNYKTFNPKQNENIATAFASYEREFKRQNLSIIGAPLALRWHFGDLNKSHFYAGADIQTNFIISADYKLNTVLKTGAHTAGLDLNENSLFSYKDFTEGIFEGGAVSDNVYLSSGIHFGLEVPAKFGTFLIGGQFQHQLFSSRLGPNNEKFASVSLQAGWRVKL